MTFSEIRSLALDNFVLGDAQTSIKSSELLRLVAVVEAARALRAHHACGSADADALDKTLAALEESK